RGFGAVVPGASAALPAAVGVRWRRRGGGWRGYRAGLAGPGGVHVVVDHRAPGFAAVGPRRRAARRRRGELAAARRGRGRGRTAAGQVHGGAARRGRAANAHARRRWLWEPARRLTRRTGDRSREKLTSASTAPTRLGVEWWQEGATTTQRRGCRVQEEAVATHPRH